MSENVNGWLNVLKEEGQTSFSVSKSLKKKFKFKKLGHLGTLDPLAKGVLPIAIGEATKTINYINNNIKRYSFTIKWGEETNTCDREGEVLSESKIRPTSKDINIIVNKFFIGKIYQVPPIFSAVKVNGVRAYSLARKKIEVKLKKKQIEIFKLEVESPQKKDFCKFDIVCGSGTYIRSLARDIAKKLGTVGYAYEIIRTEDNMFRVYNSSSGEELWSYKMESAGSAPPTIYEVNNKQYILVPAYEKTGNKVYCFTLKEN